MAKKLKTVFCPYCRQKAKLVTGDTIYPLRRDLHYKLFWSCRPCNAYVGCHQSGTGATPFGSLANKDLRQARMNAHAVFDPIWKSRELTRNEAYRWLAKELNMPPKKCHISWLDLETCTKVIGICINHLRPKPADTYVDDKFAALCAESSTRNS